jgi:hypothetical protein
VVEVEAEAAVGRVTVEAVAEGRIELAFYAATFRLAPGAPWWYQRLFL